MKETKIIAKATKYPAIPAKEIKDAVKGLLLNDWYPILANFVLRGYLNGDSDTAPKTKKVIKRVSDKCITVLSKGAGGRGVTLKTLKGTYLVDFNAAIRAAFLTIIPKNQTDKETNIFLSSILENVGINKEKTEILQKDERERRTVIETRTQVELTDTATETTSGGLAPIHEYAELVKEAQNVLENRGKDLSVKNPQASYLKMACALMLLTGRRATEILKTGEFSAIPNEPQKLLFKGQLKVKKRAEKEDFADTYTIPTLCSASQILEGFEAMRALAKETRLKNNVQDFADMSNDKVGITTAPALGECTRKLFSYWLGSNISSHNLRKAYLAIARHEYITEYKAKLQAFEQAKSQPVKGKKAQKATAHPPVLDSVEGFARSVLGHAGGNDSGEKIVDLTTRTYLFYKVVTTPKIETVQPTIPHQSEGKETTETKQPPVTLRIIELIEPLLNSTEKTAINQYTIKNLFFEKYQKYPDAISMNTVLTGVTKSPNPQIISAVLNASIRIQKHNEKVAKTKTKK